MAKKRKPKDVQIGSAAISLIGAKGRKKLAKRINDRQEGLRRRYPEVHGKVVDFINHTIEDGTLYFTVRFKDKTMFSVRCACKMYLVGAELSDVTTGNVRVIREYTK